MNLGRKAASSRRTPRRLRHSDFQKSEGSAQFPARQFGGARDSGSNLQNNSLLDGLGELWYRLS